MEEIASSSIPGEPQSYERNWYFSGEDIEKHSPSRDDGIDFLAEEHMRKLYCKLIKDLGMKFKVPQLTIATAIMFCHRFYMRQSHAKNDWQTVATVCVFLACKVEETPRSLREVVIVAYEMIFKSDPSASQRIRQSEFYGKQKQSILIGERLLMTTVAFELNIQHPYKPLVAALKKLEILQKIAKVAWNFLNDWLSTTLCLEYKPHYIAAGSVFLAAKLQKVKLPTGNGKSWWLEFDVSPKQLEVVIQRMIKYLASNQKKVEPPKSTTSSHSCVLNGSSTASMNANHEEQSATHQIQVSEHNSYCILRAGSSNGWNHNNVADDDAMGCSQAMKMRRCETLGGHQFVEAAIDATTWIDPNRTLMVSSIWN